jgi:prepilin-type N-terminal cleavage/methylation domain-containing protein
MASSKKTGRLDQGFTMIELIVVIVIIGILAAIAVPRFMDLQGQAQRSVRDGLTSNLRSAASLAYAQAAINNYTGILDAATVFAQLAHTGGLTCSGNTFSAQVNSITYTWVYTAPVLINDPTP